MSQVFIHLQGGGRKETFLRGIAENFSEEAVVAAVRKMLSDTEACNLTNVKPKSPFRGRPKKKLASLRGDEEAQIPGIVNEAVERQLDAVAA
jgi:hypothetical protein